MAVTLTTGARNAACDAIVDLIDVSTPGNFQFLDGAVAIVIIDTAATAFGAASSGAAALASTPRSGTAIANSASPGVDIFNARNGADATVFSGSCGGTGSGADIEFDNAIVLSGQTVNLNSFSLTVPAS